MLIFLGLGVLGGGVGSIFVCGDDFSDCVFILLHGCVLCILLTVSCGVFGGLSGIIFGILFFFGFVFFWGVFVVFCMAMIFLFAVALSDSRHPRQIEDVLLINKLKHILHVFMVFIGGVLMVFEGVLQLFHF